MNRTTVRRAVVVLSITLGLSACGSTPPAESESVAPAGESDFVASAPPTAGAEVAAPCQVAGVRFGYDSSELDAAARAQLESDARCAAERNVASVRVTGTTDPRGTEEYNLALGDRRAQTAASYLQSLGVEAGKIEHHSVGEEFAAGADESGWASDRRADIVAE